jgi:hypothetical protein
MCKKAHEDQKFVAKSDIQDECNEVKCSNTDAIRTSSSYVSVSINCLNSFMRLHVIEGERLLDSEDLEHLSVSEILCYRLARLVLYFAMWNILFLSANQSLP